jgi:hypothetical protein
MGDCGRGLGWVFDLLTAYRSHYKQIQHYRYFHAVQFTLTHPSVLSLLVSTSRFLATDFNTGSIAFSLNYTLQISHIEPSLHSLTSKSTNCSQFLCSQAHIEAGWRRETQLTETIFVLFITPRHGPHRNQLFYCIHFRRNVFIATAVRVTSRIVTIHLLLRAGVT